LNVEDNDKEGINYLEKSILYDVLFKHSPDFVFIHDVYGNLIDVNIALMKALGYKDKTDVLNLSLKDIIFTPDSKSKKFDYQNFLKHIIKKSISTEYMFETKKRRALQCRGL